MEHISLGVKERCFQDMEVDWLPLRCRGGWLLPKFGSGLIHDSREELEKV